LKIEIHWINPSFLPTFPITYEKEIKRKKRARLVKFMFAFILILLIIFHQIVFSFLFSRNGYIVLFVLLALLIYAHIEPFFPKFVYRSIKIERKFEPLLVIHLTDFHLQWPYFYVTEFKLKFHIRESEYS
jgi:hypothetical protein